VEIESIKYTKNKRCEFWIRNTGRGWLHAPYHSLPENTTCWYHLQATPTGVAAAGYPVDRESGSGPRYKVWVSVLKFYVTGPQTRDCTTNLMVWDGNSSCHPFWWVELFGIFRCYYLFFHIQVSVYDLSAVVYIHNKIIIWRVPLIPIVILYYQRVFVTCCTMPMYIFFHV